MDDWGLWDWTKFICCNHRPIESRDHLLLNYPQIKNGVKSEDLQDLVANSSTQPVLYRPDSKHSYYYVDDRIGYIPVESHNIMDGLRLQLIKRKGQSIRSPPVKRSNESQVTLRGWLYRLEGAALKQWKRRWCVLADYCLFYYKDMEEEKLLGSLLVPSYKITPCLNEDGIAKKYAFKAEHMNMKTYYFAADSKESQTQWMNSLSLASIMQLTTAFSTVRNQGDGQEVANNEDEEESGFASYHSRRSNTSAINDSEPFQENIGSGDKYPGSYNSVGLPLVYQQNLPQRPIQRSHYVNAPPKPKRQYYDNSDLYVIPPTAQYHSHSHQTPDLIAHDSYNSNYLPNTYYTQSFPPYEQTPSTYRLPPPSHTPRFSRLPPRPHSADFLERDQEEDELEEECQKAMSNGYNGNSGQTDGYYSGSQANEPMKIMPIRPKSSLDRYDPYSRYFFEQQTNYVTPPQYPPAPTAKEPRPWSDYLVGAHTITTPQNENQSQTFPQLSSSHLPHYHSSNANSFGMESETPRNYQREESLQRLLEWKQRMLQSPLNKRNWSQQQMQTQSTKPIELPSRPPLPEEYRSKFTIKDALKGPQQRDRDYTPVQHQQRERSKSIGDGSDFVTQNDDDLQSPQKNISVNYSSDDEAFLNLRVPYNQRANETTVPSAPDYININSFNKDSDADKESDLDISKEDYYKASTMFYHKFSDSGRQSILMSPISFSESISSKTDSIGHAFNKHDWDNVGLPVPDEASLARTASRRSLKRLNPIESKTKNKNESLKCDFNLEKREDGDGIEEYSVKCLLKKFNECESNLKQNQNSKQISNHSQSQGFSGEIGNKFENISKSLLNGNHIYTKSYVSDSEILDNNSSIADEETNISSKSAPILLSPLTKVLADLRKTADVRKEKSFSLSRNTFVHKRQPNVEEVVSDVIVTKGALQLLDTNEKSSALEIDTNFGEQSDYLNMDKVVTNEEQYVTMNAEEMDKESDAGDDADDEASRDFDNINHQSNVVSDNDIKLKAGCKVRTYKKPRPEPVPNISNQLNSRLSLSPNPAYEALGDVRVATDADVKTTANNEVKSSVNTEKQRSPNAPYYMSDLLSEEQQIALQEKLAARQTGSPPPLLSRCNALNNTRYLGTTSLQKCDVGKRVNNIIVNPINKNESSVSLNNCITNNMNNNNAIQTSSSDSIESSLKSLLSPNVSKFLDSERNKYCAGHTLQKVPQNAKSFASYTSLTKRCITPEIDNHFPKTDLEFEAQNCFIENSFSLKRRSKSLEGLMDQNNSKHIYENLGQNSSDLSAQELDVFLNGSDINYSDDDLMGSEALRRVSKRHFAENFSTKSSPISQQTVPLVESCDKSFDDFSESESDLSSLIELSLDSVSGPIMAEKVRRRRSSHKRRSKDDMNASDSEVQKGNPLTARPMHVRPKLLRDYKSTRLCVSTGDLLGKSHEELVLLLIQLRRSQSRIAKNCDQLRLHMESEQKMIEIEPHRRDEHKQKYRELRERLADTEKQYEMQFPMINTIDNMIKMHNTVNSEEFVDNRAKAASTSVLDQVGSGQVSLEEENSNLSALQMDREILERTLEGVKSKVAKMGTELVPVIDIEKLKKHQKIIEGELGRVRGLLSHSAKRLEEKAAENAQIEQDVLIAQNKIKEVLATEEALESSRASSLEAELAQINQVIDDLHNRRVELNATIESIKTSDKKREIVRASPTGLAGSMPLPGRKKIINTYMETDIDSGDSRDLAHCPRNSGSEGEDTQTPLYENLENNSLNDLFLSQFQPSNEDLFLCAPEDIIDEQMRQFYGIIPMSQKANEIKTVRIVKREAERRRVNYTNGSSKSMDSFWLSGQYDNDFTAGAVGGIGSIPPPYYYEDRDDDIDTEAILKSLVQTDDYNNGHHYMIDDLNGEFQRSYNIFQNSKTTNNKTFLSNNNTISQSQQEQLFSRPERTRSASLSLPSTSCNSSLSSTPFPIGLTQVRKLESKYGPIGTTRRHHTISCSQPHLSQTHDSISKMWRSRDDTDIDIRYRNNVNNQDIDVQHRNNVNTPDIVKSTIKKSEDFDEKLIEREIMAPKMIDIPERYIRDDEPEEMSASEKLKRSLKAEMIRKMLSESSTYEDVRRDSSHQMISSSSSSSALGSDENVLSEENRSKVCEEKRRRAQLLALNHELAKEVMERSKIVSVLAQLSKYDDNDNESRFEEIRNCSEKDLIDVIEREWPQTNRQFI